MKDFFDKASFFVFCAVTFSLSALKTRTFWIVVLAAVLLTACGGGAPDHTETNPFDVVEESGEPDLAEDQAEEQPESCILEECDDYPHWDVCTRDVPPYMCWLIKDDE